nr:hypothetical protein [Rhodococcus fascians]
MRALIVEDELFLAEAVRDGLRLGAIAADIAGDRYTALEINDYDVVVLDRDIPGPHGDTISRHLAGFPTSPRILMVCRRPSRRQELESREAQTTTRRSRSQSGN